MAVVATVSKWVGGAEGRGSGVGGRVGDGWVLLLLLLLLLLHGHMTAAACSLQRQRQLAASAPLCVAHACMCGADEPTRHPSS